jgi:hypothetical protein
MRDFEVRGISNRINVDKMATIIMVVVLVLLRMMDDNDNTRNSVLICLRANLTAQRPIKK